MYGARGGSKLQTKALANIASSTGGNYFSGNNLEEAINQLIANLEKSTASSSTTISSQSSIHYYQYFLAVSVLLFFLIYLFNPKKDFNL